jgi:hypothetical protein
MCFWGLGLMGIRLGPGHPMETWFSTQIGFSDLCGTVLHATSSSLWHVCLNFLQDVIEY